AVIVLALLSWAFASRIPATTPSAADLPITSNPWTSTVGLLKSLYREPRLWDGMVIVSWFWLVGAVVLSLLPALVRGGVGGSEGVVTLCLAVFAIGIAAGSLFAAQLSHVRPNLALVPIGAIVMGVVGLDLALAIAQTVRGTHVSPMAFATSFAGLRMLADFAVFAFGGGLFVVPSFAAVQAWSAVFRSAGSSLASRSQASARCGSCSANGARRACAISARCCSALCSAPKFAAWKICRRPALAC